ncbi:FAD-binding oxidoreductase [Desulfococcaceae bacterium HSG9]|nr:FAD-binding oxidoreductase [Desulfococcaceae bacterium HSG9]
MSTTLNSNETGPGLQAVAKAGVAVQTVKRPTSLPEICELLQEAFQTKRTVLPVGGGTALGVALLPEKTDILLDMTGFNDLLSFDGKNLNMTVQTGMTVDAINTYLNKEGFRLPLDPPLSQHATIGGVYAANMAGPSRLLYGSLRDQAMGGEAMDAQGNAFKFGGITVKNVSGYDLTKFFIGSAGRLCVVTSLALRIQPLPEAACLCEANFTDVTHVQNFVSELLSSVLVPSGVVVTTETQAPDFKVLTAFEGHPGAVERQNRDFSQWAAKNEGRTLNQEGREAVTRDFGTAIDPDDTDANVLSLKITTPIVQGIPALSAIHKLAIENEVPAKLALLSGNGIIYVYLSEADIENLAALVKGIRDIAKKSDGYALPLKAPHEILSAWGPRVTDTELSRLVLQPLKQKLDPAGVFLPLG